jgi:hypothetical protein
VPEEFDAAKAATLLVRLHGKEAREVARKRADTRMICRDANGMEARALVIKAVEDRGGSADPKPPSVIHPRPPASTSAPLRRQTLMRWAGEPKLEEVLSDPIVRAVMERDRVDQDGLRRLLRNTTKLLALRTSASTKHSATGEVPAVSTELPRTLV